MSVGDTCSPDRLRIEVWGNSSSRTAPTFRSDLADGDAKPLAVLLSPCVREAALMGIGFPFLGPLFASRAGDDHGIAVAVQLHVIGNFDRKLVGLVANGGQELGLG